MQWRQPRAIEPRQVSPQPKEPHHEHDRIQPPLAQGPRRRQGRPRRLGRAIHGERVAVALVLNRADWLAGMGYTLADAIKRTGAAWLELVPRVAQQLQDEQHDSEG